jgi:hypothetical protein
MHEWEYRFIEQYLTGNDILLEWGSGNSTLYWSGIVSNVISIEHDVDWVEQLSLVMTAHEVNNVELHHVPAHSPNPIPCRYEQFKSYIHYPETKQFSFTKVLIDGRARKYCAKALWNIINDDVLVFIHDFNRPDYQRVLKYYDIVDVNWDGQGIACLKKKSSFVDDGDYY